MVQYRLIRSKNRRRSLSMKVDSQGEVVVSAPILMPKFFIDRFVSGHTQWIIKQKKTRQEVHPKLRMYFQSPGELETYIRHKTLEYSKVVGLYPTRLRFRHVKTYWGSCSIRGAISFNQNLQYAPPEAVDYVIVHELCHLKYRGHGIRFWDLVKKYYPQTNEMKSILRHIAHGDLTD